MRTAIYEIISGDLHKGNINNANERMECAKRIEALLDAKNHFLTTPRDGVVLYFREGDGRVDLIAKSDPVVDPQTTWRRIMEKLERFRL